MPMPFQSFLTDVPVLLSGLRQPPQPEPGEVDVVVVVGVDVAVAVAVEHDLHTVANPDKCRANLQLEVGYSISALRLLRPERVDDEYGVGGGL